MAVLTFRSNHEVEPKRRFRTISRWVEDIKSVLARKAGLQNQEVRPALFWVCDGAVQKLEQTWETLATESLTLKAVSCDYNS